MTPFSCIVLGNESLLVACADMLLARSHSIAAVVTKDAEIRQWAADKGLSVLEDARDFGGSVDWLLSIANLEIIPDSVLARASKGGVNFHDGPLPRYAGLNTPNWALIEGATEYGITWHMIEGGVDEGDILAQRLFAIAGDETAYSLNAKCYAAAMDSFGDVLGQLETGTLARQAQDFSTRKLYTRANRPEAGALLDLTQPAADLYRLVRALDFNGYWNPLCAAKVQLSANSGVPIALIGTAEIAEGSGVPGTVLSVDAKTVTLACGDGALRLGGLHHSDGRPIRATDHVQTGDVLPSLDAEDRRDLTRQLTATQASESKWRKALAALPAVDLPLAGPAIDAPADITHHTLSHNVALTEIDVLSVALALTLCSSGAEAAGIALRDRKSVV